MNGGLIDVAHLQVSAGAVFIPVVTSFAESMALALGLGRTEALALTLAAEEVFSHLCRVVLPKGGLVEIRCSGGGYFVETDFMFPAADFEMRAFNITATVSPMDDAQIEEMGLLLASRSVDRFRVSRKEGREIKLTLIKEKTYPPASERPALSAKPLDRFTIRPPDSGELKLFADLVDTYYHGHMAANVFKHPGKLVDMVEYGEYKAAVAVGPSGHVGGGTFWRGTGTRAVEWFGPYLFNQNPDSGMAAALLDSCMAAIARTPAVVLINRFPTPELPRRNGAHRRLSESCCVSDLLQNVRPCGPAHRLPGRGPRGR